MLIVTTESIAGKELEMLGLVKGSTIQSKHLGSDISQSFKTLVGGELKSYTEMMNDARALATKRMVQEAEALGADAVVCGGHAGRGRGHGLRHRRPVPRISLWQTTRSRSRCG